MNRGLTVPKEILTAREGRTLQALSRSIGWWTALLPLGLTILFALVIPAIADGEIVRISYPWVPSLDISLSFYVDGLGLVMALLVSGIGALIYLYAGRYLAWDRSLCYLRREK
jgi:multicomponent Na+:H+ antiporter subunit A